MSFDPHIAEQRFGYGLSPDVPPPPDVTAMLRGVEGPDAARAAFPLPPFRHLQDAITVRRRYRSYARKFPDTEEGKAARQREQSVLRDMRKDHDQWFAQIMLRRITTPHAFRERLVAFWADHFTALGKGGLLRVAAPLFVEDVVRPHVAGRFEDMLIQAVTHPVMLHYLDQDFSVGPNSRVARRREGRQGLNENLAREVMELHTLGVDGPYDQTDVRQLAELFAGLSRTRDYSFKFRSGLAEPGSETVLGKKYGGKARLAEVRALLTDLARHPSTARHVARKLAVHFVADTPPLAIVQAVEAAYLQSDGDLMACYDALLGAPEAWTLPTTNMRPPEEFVGAALRALAPGAQAMGTLETQMIRELFFRPLRLMGQPWMRPNGPDGFDEADKAWITPQGISARLEWAVTTPGRILSSLPDPRHFVTDALGAEVPERVAFAVSAAESRAVAVGLILTSPAFQRR